MIVVYIHGIGSQEVGWSKSFDSKLRKFTPALFQSIELSWQSNCSGLHNYNKLLMTNRGWLTSPSKLFIEYAGDALMYLSGRGEGSLYSNIHSLIETKLKEAATNSVAGGNERVLFVTHSLGSIVATNFIYDKLSKGKPLFDGANINEISLVTMGSPFSLVSLGYSNTNPIPVTKWTNIYSKHDLISYPIANLSPQYARLVKDIRVRIGRGLSMFTPACHTAYWDSNLVAKIVSNLI